MYVGEDPTRPQTMRRCPDDSHDHTGPPRWGGSLAVGPAVRSAPDVRAVLVELGRRRCGGGPLGVSENGEINRQDPLEFISTALAALPEHEDARALARVLHDMDVTDVERLRSFRRLVAVEVAIAALEWAVAPEGPAAADAEARLLREVDDPSLGWT